MPFPHLQIVLPVYNEAKNIALLLESLEQTLATALQKKCRWSYLVINDGSKDNTLSVLMEEASRRKNLKVINLIHNFGHSNALACGIDHFDADLAVIMDADGQDDPTAIALMFEEWEKGCKTVVAERISREEKSGILFHLFYFLLHKFSKSIPQIAFGTYSLLDKEIIFRIQKLREKIRYFPGLVSLVSNEIKAIPVPRKKRVHGKSQVGMTGLIQLAMTAFINYSSAPMKLVSFLSFLSSALAITSATVIVGIKFFSDKAIPGWASTMTALFFGNAIQLFCLSIIAEYLCRVHDEVKDRPLYLVDFSFEGSQKQLPSFERKSMLSG